MAKALFVLKDTPAAELLKRECATGNIMPGAIVFVTTEEFGSLQDDVEYLEVPDEQA